MADIPKPLATAECEVTHDPASKSLYVRPSKGAGYAGLLWRRGHEAMQEGGRSNASAFSWGQSAPAPTVWANGARGTPVEGGWLKFTPSAAVYRELTADQLGAIVTVDRATGHILGVRFRNQP